MTVETGTGVIFISASFDYVLKTQITGFVKAAEKLAWLIVISLLLFVQRMFYLLSAHHKHSLTQTHDTGTSKQSVLGVNCCMNYVKKVYIFL